MRDKEKKPDEQRISLAGVDPEEALRALLKVDPDSKPADERPQEAADSQKSDQ